MFEQPKRGACHRDGVLRHAVRFHTLTSWWPPFGPALALLRRALPKHQAAALTRGGSCMVRRRDLVGMTPLGSHVAFLVGGAVLLALQGRHSLAARVQSRPVPLEPTFFHDTLLSKVPTAGSVRAGILAGASGDRTDPTRLTAFLPANATGTLCVNIISQDGRYEAIAQYRLGGVPVGARRLRLKTSYQSQLARYAPRQLAVLARIAPRCDESASTTLFVVTSWTGEIAPGVLLLINSRANTRIDEVTSAGLKTI